MHTFLQIILTFTLLSLNAICAKSSFFMTEDQSKMILFQLQDSKGIQSSDNSLKLRGIFYIDEENWTIWINDISYSTPGKHDLFSIDAVSENSVSLTLSNGSSVVLEVAEEDEEPLEQKAENPSSLN